VSSNDNNVRILAVDVGTNSTLWMIADFGFRISEFWGNDTTAEALTLIERGIEYNGLGAGLTAEGRISDEQFSVNRQIIEKIVRHGRESGCNRYGAVGTHALRKAVNSAEFLKMSNELGLPLEIISDEQEAELAWKGVFQFRNADFGILNSEKGQIALLDLGGGSTELALGKAEKIEWAQSLPLGAVTLARQFFQHDPPTSAEISAAKEAAQQTFSGWKGRLSEDSSLVLIAGTATALTAIENGITTYTPGCLEGLTLSLPQVQKWCDRLLKMSLEERKTIPGMPVERAGSIHAGALLLVEILTVLGKKEAQISERGVMFGLAMDIIAHGDAIG
jgi:exopolyphosphatase/guanosine-5'-triphosphate,3'-diphosphate pyrophosphatase